MRDQGDLVDPVAQARTRRSRGNNRSVYAPKVPLVPQAHSTGKAASHAASERVDRVAPASASDGVLRSMRRARPPQQAASSASTKTGPWSGSRLNQRLDDGAIQMGNVTCWECASCRIVGEVR